MRGTLFLVVGPSGAGKDSLIDGARAELAGRRDIVFASRVITRPPKSGDEDNLFATPEEFAAMQATGAFMLHWEAHGLFYGIPAEAANLLACGTSVVANVSRSVLPAARAAFEPAHILSVLVPRDVLAKRLRARGREDEDDIADRLRRAEAFDVSGDDVSTILNGGSLATGIGAMVEAITRRIP